MSTRRPRPSALSLHSTGLTPIALGAGALLVLAGWIVLAASCGAGDHDSPLAKTGGAAPIAGPPFPALTLRDLGGARRAVADYEGQPVIVNFWATWCAPCRREMPSLVSLQNRFADRGLRVLAVSIDEDSGAVREYVSANALPFEVFWDPAKEAYGTCGVAVTPTAFIVDRQGRVVERIDGEIDWTNPGLIATLEQLLEAV